ncbi:MAG: hypothetical protein R3D29_03345 [Nitratireductor sp.]
MALAHNNLPIFMTSERAVAIFVRTDLRLSGLMAIRKLKAADPADLSRGR